MVFYHQGLQYLHRSDLKYHGALKSTNCLIDGRWNLKLSDYGPREFLKGQIKDRQDDEFARHKRKNSIQKDAKDIMRA